MRFILAAIMVLSASAAVAHAAETPARDLPPTHAEVTGARPSQVEENALAKTIEQENERIDRQLRGICRGC